MKHKIAGSIRPSPSAKSELPLSNSLSLNNAFPPTEVQEGNGLEFRQELQKCGLGSGFRSSFSGLHIQIQILRRFCDDYGFTFRCSVASPHCLLRLCRSKISEFHSCLILVIYTSFYFLRDFGFRLVLKLIFF